MKRTVYFIMGVVAVLLIHNSLRAQNATQRYLMEKLRFYYVEAPSNILPSGRVMHLDNKRIFSGESEKHWQHEYIKSRSKHKPTVFKPVNRYRHFWNNDKMKNAQILVKALLCDSKNGGDASLQSFARQICKIQDKPIQIWLYDDASAKFDGYSKQVYRYITDDKGYIWPCASSYQNAKEDWAGIIHLGEKNMNDKGLRWAKATFLHELVHTQDHSNSGAHMFYSRSTKQNYKYGVDADHYAKEAVPSLFSAYKEGIANTISFLYDGTEARRYFRWFANNDYLWVETAANEKATDIPEDVWLYKAIRKVAGDGDSIRGLDAYRGYKIRNLPPGFIIHNEVIIALIMAKYVDHVNLNRFIEAVKKTNTVANQKNQSSLAVLIERMCELGLPEGQTLDDVFGVNRGEPKLFLLPLAYTDYFTGYSAQSKADYTAIFEGKLSQKWVDLYWDWMKDAVRQAVPAVHPKYEDLTAIAAVLDIESNVADAIE